MAIEFLSGLIFKKHVSNESMNKVNILGVGISPVNISQAVDTITKWVETKQKNYVCVTPAHGIMDCQQDGSLRRIFNGSGLTTPDGMSIVWILNLLGYRNVNRVYGPDLMQSVCKYSSDNEKYTHFLYGGLEGVPEKLARELTQVHPNLNIVGAYSPPFGPIPHDEDKKIVDRINVLSPDIIWIGISTPKQERWMASHIDLLNASVIIGVGAAFDFLSGTKHQAPRWMQRYGLEWLFRLFNEPKRLWRRYILYPYFLILVIAQFLGVKEYSLDFPER